ncbi:unnamed protein product [Lampetra planeri]
MMSWRPQYRSSKFRHVFGRPAKHCYDSVPITRSVHDNHFCAVNPRFLAVVTECAGGGAFLVLPLQLTGKVDPHYPRVCGHQAIVLDIKWSPFNDFIIASASDDATVRVWEIPEGGLHQQLTEPLATLRGHSRRVSLIEWHPVASGLLFSTGYDCKVLLWDVEKRIAVRSFDCHGDIVLSMSFDCTGNVMATACKDKNMRLIDARTGAVLKHRDGTPHRAQKVVVLGDTKMLASTGISWSNQRQIAVWHQEDLSKPLVALDLDGISGLLFLFFDSDTRMLFVVGKGDTTIRYYEISTEMPFLHFLGEYHSHQPQKGMGMMPKRGVDTAACEVFRFYKLIVPKGTIEPISMIVPRRSEAYQEDIYPLTAGPQPALSADEWLSGINKGPKLVSLKDGALEASTSVAVTPGRADLSSATTATAATAAGVPREVAPAQRSFPRHRDQVVVNGHEGANDSNDKVDGKYRPPPDDDRLRQQEQEIRNLRSQLAIRDARIRQLELELRNLHNSASRAVVHQHQHQRYQQQHQQQAQQQQQTQQQAQFPLATVGAQVAAPLFLTPADASARRPVLARFNSAASSHSSA